MLDPSLRPKRARPVDAAPAERVVASEPNPEPEAPLDIGNVNPFGDDRRPTFSSAARMRNKAGQLSIPGRPKRPSSVLLNPLAAGLDQLATSGSADRPGQTSFVRRISSFLLPKRVSAASIETLDLSQDVEMGRREPRQAFAEEDQEDRQETRMDAADAGDERLTRVTARLVANERKASATGPRVRLDSVSGRGAVYEGAGLDYSVTLNEGRPKPPFTHVTAVSYAQLRAHVAMLKEHELMEAEFDAVMKASPALPHADAIAPAAAARNRFRNVLANDERRVRLRGRKAGEDYINADYVDGYLKPKAIIATQGPMMSTTSDFWQMIWDEGSHVIVMMTELEEGGRPKCHRYWPEAGAEEDHGGVSVLLVHETVTKELSDFELSVQNKMTGEDRTVHLFQMHGWPDHGIPESPALFVRNVITVKDAHMAVASPGPLVIHCSAGVGRTGVFCLVDICLHSILDSGYVDVPHTLLLLRLQREGLVQTKVQYEFCYEVLVALLADMRIDSGEYEQPGDVRVRRALMRWKNQLDAAVHREQTLLGHQGTDDPYLDVTADSEVERALAGANENERGGRRQPGPEGDADEPADRDRAHPDVHFRETRRRTSSDAAAVMPKRESVLRFADQYEAHSRRMSGYAPTPEAQFVGEDAQQALTSNAANYLATARPRSLQADHEFDLVSTGRDSAELAGPHVEDTWL